MRTLCPLTLEFLDDQEALLNTPWGIGGGGGSIYMPEERISEQAVLIKANQISAISSLVKTCLRCFQLELVAREPFQVL